VATDDHVTEDVHAKPMAEFTIKNLHCRKYVVHVVEDGTVEDLLDALQEALDQSKSIGELLYNGEEPIKSKLLSELDDTSKFLLIEKCREHGSLTTEEKQLAVNLDIAQDDAEFLKAIFLGFDLNNDGKCSLSELRSILRGLQRGREPTEAEVSAFAFFLGDSSGDLNITFHEFLKMNSIFKSKGSHKAVGVFKLFEMFDTKSDQELSKKEFKEL